MPNNEHSNGSRGSLSSIRVNVAIDNGPPFVRQGILLERDLVP